MRPSPMMGPSALSAPRLSNAGMLPPLASQQQTVWQRCLAAMPPATMSFVALTLLAYLLAWLLSTRTPDYDIQSYLVVYKLQLYRLVASSFVHGHWVHLLVNVASLYFLGSALERVFGTVQFFILTWLFILLGGVVYVLISLCLSYVLLRDIEWYVYTRTNELDVNLRTICG